MSADMHDGTMEENYEPVVVALSFGISLIGAYVGISLAEIFRVKVIDIRHGIQEQSFLHYYYLFLMALSLGGVAIWSMHFIGMHAVSLHHAQSLKVSIRYNLGLSLASLIAVVLMVFGGLVIASRDRMFCKTKAEIVEMFMNDAKKLSIAEIRKITATRMLILIATRELGTLVAGGITTSAGVCIMHYIGMASMMFDGQIRWNAGIVALSVVIAMVASTAAFWILFRLLSIFPEMEWLRMASAFIMAVAVNGMHYTGMVAAEFVEAPSSKEHGSNHEGMSVEVVRAFLFVLIASNVIIWILAHFSFSSSRELVQEKAARLRETRDVLQKLMTISNASGINGFNNMQRVLEQYAKREEKQQQLVEFKATQALHVFCACCMTRKGVAPEPGTTSGYVSSIGNESSISRRGIPSSPRAASGLAVSKDPLKSLQTMIAAHSGVSTAATVSTTTVFPPSDQGVAEDASRSAEMV